MFFIFLVELINVSIIIVIRMCYKLKFFGFFELKFLFYLDKIEIKFFLKDYLFIFLEKICLGIE